MPTASWRSAPTCRCSATSAGRCSATSRPIPCSRATSTGTTTATARAARSPIPTTRCCWRRCSTTASAAASSWAGRISPTSAACAPGSISPDTLDIFQEGIIVPPTKLIDAGKTNEATLKIFFRNSRFPEQNMGDMRALMASTSLGVKRIEEIVARFGADVVADALAPARRPHAQAGAHQARRDLRLRHAHASPTRSIRTATATARSTSGWR